MIFLPGFAQIRQLCEIFRRALGWTWGLIPLPFHGQSLEESSAAVFPDPSALAPRCQLGKNPDIYRDEAFRMHEALREMQEIWKPYMHYRFVRSCIICTNVAESGVTVANVGLVAI